MTNGPLYFDDVAEGDTWTSTSRTMTETDVVMFASMTGDFNPLHVDHHFAADTPYRGPIAHGLLGIAWVAGLGNHAPFMKTEAFVAIHEWKFLKPIMIGTTVHIATSLVEKRDTGRRRGTIIWRRKLVDVEGTVLQEGLFESIVSKRKPEKKA